MEDYKEYDEFTHADLGKAYISAYMSDDPNSLEHYGVKGMKWGVRRTAAQLGHTVSRGAQKVGKMISAGAKKAGGKISDKRSQRKEFKRIEKLMSKPVRKLSESEYKERMERMQKEKNMLDLQRSVNNLDQKAASAGKTFMEKIMVPAAIDAGKNQITKFLNNTFAKALGLSEKEDVSNSYDLIRDGINKLSELNDEQIRKVAKRYENINTIKKGRNDEASVDEDTGAAAKERQRREAEQAAKEAEAKRKQEAEDAKKRKRGKQFVDDLDWMTDSWDA